MSLHLLNTAIIPWFDGGATVEVRSLSLEEAKSLLQEHTLVSHVGHQATASVLSGLLGREVKMDRSPWDGSGVALVFQSHSRLEEGKIYSAEEMAALKFGFRMMEIVRE